MRELIQCPVNFNQDKHEYWLGDKQLSGVTGMIHDVLFPDKTYDKNDPRVIAAADKGTLVHGQIELLETGFAFDPDTAMPEIRGYMRLRDEYGFKVVATEYLVSDLVNIASSIDLVLDNDCLADIKTTSVLDRDYLSWQLSTYAFLYELQNNLAPGTVKHLYGIWLRPDKCKFVEIRRRADKEIVQLISDYVNKTPTALQVKEAVPDQVLALRDAIEDTLQEYKRQEAKLDEFRSRLQSFMKDNNYKTIDMGTVRMTLKDASKRKSFDHKSFIKDHPEFDGEYMKESVIKESVTITLR